MKCTIIILAVAVLSHASSLRGVEREIRVNGDRRIFIRGSNKIVVFNVPRDDPKGLELVVKDYGSHGKIIKMDENKRIIKQIDFVPGSGADKTVFADWDSNDKVSN